jgi:hypothetical protein
MSKKRPKLEHVRIVRANGGGPIRTIVAAVVGRPTGTFTSLKAGLTFGWEAEEPVWPVVAGNDPL